MFLCLFNNLCRKIIQDYGKHLRIRHFIGLFLDSSTTGSCKTGSKQLIVRNNREFFVFFDIFVIKARCDTRNKIVCIAAEATVPISGQN